MAESMTPPVTWDFASAVEQIEKCAFECIAWRWLREQVTRTPSPESPATEAQLNEAARPWISSGAIPYPRSLSDISAEQIARWRKALADTGEISLVKHGKTYRMDGALSGASHDLAELYNWLADIDERLARWNQA